MRNFFILGCPRSGTTMLQQALNRHTQIVIPPETKFFFSFLGHSRRAQVKHIERLNHDLCIHLPVPSRRIANKEEAREFFNQMVSLYLERLAKTDVLYFGEKTPEHTGQITKIKQVFPKAKILFIYRDGRDVAASLTKVPWMHRNLYVNFAVWLYYYRILRRSQRDPNLDLLCVKYEDLVTHPEVEFAGILDFLGLPYEAPVVEGYGNKEGVPLREYPWKARALERITAERIGVWQRDFTKTEIHTMERFGGRALESLGYELTSRGRDKLPLHFYTALSSKLLLLGLRLPWRSVVNELLEQLMYLEPARNLVSIRRKPNND